MKIVKSVYEKDSKMLQGKKTLSVSAIIVALGFIEQSGVINIIPENYKGFAIASIGFVMAGLRLITKTPISK